MIGDVITQELPAALKARIGERLVAGRDHLFRLAFSGEGVGQPVISETIRRFDIDISILHGQVDEIQGQPFGSLAVLVTGAAGTVAEAMASLRERGVIAEELSHV